jgi:enoyl-CoA hydratase
MGNRVMRTIENLDMPVIAAVNGFALGGGCELAMACDVRIAGETASFAQPETGLGITPGFGGTQRMARLIGPAKAKELIYTCRRVKAEEARAIGLVNLVVAPEALMDAARDMAVRIAQNVPRAVRSSKAAIDQGLDLPMNDAVNLEAQFFSGCFVTEDRREAMAAFVEKRKPAPFENR